MAPFRTEGFKLPIGSCFVDKEQGKVGRYLY
jgi:hypothetical protein